MTNAYDTPAIADFVAARLAEEEAAFSAAGSRWRPPMQRSPGVRRSSASTARQATAACRATLAEWTCAASARSGGSEAASAYADGLAMAVAMLATTWRDHPGYDPDWFPSGSEQSWHAMCASRDGAARTRPLAPLG